MSLKLSMQCGAGKRRVRVVCQVASSAAANGSYEVLPTFTSSFERFAEDLKTSGREFTIAMQQVGNLYGIIKLPYDPKTASLTARDRVIIDGSILHIAAPPNNENGQRERIVLWVVQAEGTIQ